MLGMEAVGVTLMAYLRYNMNYLCQLEEICDLSESMIIKLFTRLLLYPL